MMRAMEATVRIHRKPDRLQLERNRDRLESLTGEQRRDFIWRNIQPINPAGPSTAECTGPSNGWKHMRHSSFDANSRGATGRGIPGFVNCDKHEPDP